MKWLKPIYWLPIHRRFQIITAKRLWGGKESLSGEGSDLDSTVTVRRRLPELLQELQVKSMLDIPCGDFHWMKEVALDGIEYTGGDILPSLIELNRQYFAGEGIKFRVMDISKDPLPESDIILCRDCMVHLSNGLIGESLANIKASNSKYLLTTTFPDIKSNVNIPTGSWRPINLTIPPFNLPQPIKVIEDSDNQPTGLPRAELGLWRISDISGRNS